MGALRELAFERDDRAAGRGNVFERTPLILIERWPEVRFRTRNDRVSHCESVDGSERRGLSPVSASFRISELQRASLVTIANEQKRNSQREGVP